MAPAPPATLRPGPWQWLRRELFGSRLDGLISIALLGFLVAAAQRSLRGHRMGGGPELPERGNARSRPQLSPVARASRVVSSQRRHCCSSG